MVLAVGNIWTKRALTFDTTETSRMQTKTVIGTTFCCVKRFLADGTKVTRFLKKKLVFVVISLPKSILIKITSGKQIKRRLAGFHKYGIFYVFPRKYNIFLSLGYRESPFGTVRRTKVLRATHKGYIKDV